MHMPLAFRVYNSLLFLALVVVLALTLVTSGFSVGDAPIAWFALTVLLFITERADLNFYDERARFGLSTSEAVLFPMLLASSFTGLVWGVTIAMTLERITRGVGLAKSIFNVASFGCAIAVAGALWSSLRDGTNEFSLRNAIVATAALLAFALLTHLFTALAISFAEGANAWTTTKSLAPATVINFTGSMIVGLFFAASFAAASWTIVLFPAAIGALYFGFRAVLHQSRERERVQALHAASRALAAGRDLAQAAEGFLVAVQDIASAGRAFVVLPSGEYEKTDPQWIYSMVAGGQAIASLEPVGSEGLQRLIEAMSIRTDPIVAGPDDDLTTATTQGLDATGLVAVRLTYQEQFSGVLGVFDRVGADEFDDDDARLLEALANELQLSLESYRLFAEISEERQRFGRIFVGSKEGICLLDSSGTVRAWNPALETISEHSADEVMGRVWSDVVMIRDHNEYRIQGDELVGVEPDEELELVTKSGPSRWITTVSGPVGEAEGGGWVVLVRDVSAEHEVEAAKSDFLSTISHELRTPLTSIKGSLQVLGRGMDTLPGDVADQMISVTSRGAERLERLVMNLLVVSQLDSGTMSVFPDEVSLNDILLDRVEALLSDHPTKKIDLPEEPIVVRADRERVAHVLEHLLENARKFGGPHGTIEVSAHLDSGYASVSVSDEGPGIPEADRERVFERFVRLGNVLTRETQGAGVGLFIAKRSVEAMGGHISVESEPGKGSTFTVTLPLAKPMALSAGADSA